MKAIFVVDIPNETNINELERMMKDGERASIVCNVLKIEPIPEKIDRHRGQDDYADGFNYCIDKIMGETE